MHKDILFLSKCVKILYIINLTTTPCKCVKISYIQYSPTPLLLTSGLDTRCIQCQFKRKSTRPIYFYLRAVLLYESALPRSVKSHCGPMMSWNSEQCVQKIHAFPRVLHISTLPFSAIHPLIVDTNSVPADDQTTRSVRLPGFALLIADSSWMQIYGEMRTYFLYEVCILINSHKLRNSLQNANVCALITCHSMNESGICLSHFVDVQVLTVPYFRFSTMRVTFLIF